MSGLASIGGLPGFAQAGQQVAQKDIDQYQVIAVDSPSVSAAWAAAGTVAGTAVTPLVLANLNMDWPRNFMYGFTGGTSGGTFVVNGLDQFGKAFTETVALGSVAGGGSVYGTAIAAKFISGTIFPNTSTTGTYTVGAGTASNGSAQSNWFGLLTKLAGTADVKNITWITTNTVTTLNKGTALGTLVDANRAAFQGTSGVAITDHYKVLINAEFDNASFGTMSGL